MPKLSWIMIVVVFCLASAAVAAGTSNTIWTISSSEVDLNFASILTELPSVTYRYYTSKPRLVEWEIGGLILGFNLLFIDEPVYEQLQQVNLFPQEFWTAVSVLGDARVHLALSMLLCLNGIDLGFDLFHALFYNAVNTALIKVTTGMARPELGLGPGFYGPNLDSAYAAMPSGHTSSSFATAAVLSEYFPTLETTWYTAAGLIGLSRIFLEQHWPSNVVLGAVVGHVSARHYLGLEEIESD